MTKQLDINPVFIKLDVEGAELECLEEYLDNSCNPHPLVIEVEINVGQRGSNDGCGSVLTRLDQRGYRLLDLRKTYDYALVDGQFGDLLVSEELHCPAFQGMLHQFDGLFIDKSIFENSCSSTNLELLVPLLASYRQFGLAARLIQTTDSNHKDTMFSFLESVFKFYRDTSRINSSAAFGFHPLFNWLKSV